MSWWTWLWKRPHTDGGSAARRHLERVAEQQEQVDELLARLERRKEANHFREAFEQALRRT